jgi:hypothetical protein
MSIGETATTARPLPGQLASPSRRCRLCVIETASVPRLGWFRFWGNESSLNNGISPSAVPAPVKSNLFKRADVREPDLLSGSIVLDASHAQAEKPVPVD